MMSLGNGVSKFGGYFGSMIFFLLITASILFILQGEISRKESQLGINVTLASPSFARRRCLQNWMQAWLPGGEIRFYLSMEFI